MATLTELCLRYIAKFDYSLQILPLELQERVEDSQYEYYRSLHSIPFSKVVEELKVVEEYTGTMKELWPMHLNTPEKRSFFSTTYLWARTDPPVCVCGKFGTTTIHQEGDNLRAETRCEKC